MAGPVPVSLGKTMCSFGMAPGTLMVLPVNRVLAQNKPVANIQDQKPFVNIIPFGMCTSLANPAVAAATTAALGVLTPVPCAPIVVAPWTPGSPKVLVGNQPVLGPTSMCTCAWAGVITIGFPGQTSVVTT